MSAKHVPPAIDCAKCRYWAVRCASDLEPVYALGYWHHPVHAEDLLQLRYGWLVTAPAVRLPTGEAMRVVVGAPFDDEVH